MAALDTVLALSAPCGLVISLMASLTHRGPVVLRPSCVAGFVNEDLGFAPYSAAGAIYRSLRNRERSARSLLWCDNLAENFKWCPFVIAAERQSASAGLVVASVPSSV